MPHKNPDKFKIAKKYQGTEDDFWQKFPIDYDGNLVDLGQGFPDYTPSSEIVDILGEICKDGNHFNHQYARAFGHVRFVEALANLYGKLIGRTIDPYEEIIISGGAHGVLFCTIMGNVNPGDEVIIIEPAFDCYEPMIRLAGGIPIFFPLVKRKSTGPKLSSADYKLDMDHLRATCNDKTKAIMLTTPNNPYGKIFSRKELMELGNLCEEYDVLIISDEVYEWYFYDDNEHIRICSLANFWERTITIGSAGKSFGLTGWKVGWAYGPKDLMFNVGIAHQNSAYQCQTPQQEALAIAFEKETPLLGTSESFFKKMMVQLTEKRNRLIEAVEKIGAKPIIPEGGYFLTVDWEPIQDKIDLSQEDSEDPDEVADFKFARWLIRHKKLIGIPPSAFYSPDHRPGVGKLIRFNFHKKIRTLEAAEKILSTFYSDDSDSESNSA